MDVRKFMEGKAKFEASFNPEVDLPYTADDFLSGSVQPQAVVEVLNNAVEEYTWKQVINGINWDNWVADSYQSDVESLVNAMGQYGLPHMVNRDGKVIMDARNGERFVVSDKNIEQLKDQWL